MIPHVILLPNLKILTKPNLFLKMNSPPPPPSNKMASTNPNPLSQVINDQPLYDVSLFN